MRKPIQRQLPLEDSVEDTTGERQRSSLIFEELVDGLRALTGSGQIFFADGVLPRFTDNHLISRALLFSPRNMVRCQYLLDTTIPNDLIIRAPKA